MAITMSQNPIRPNNKGANKTHVIPEVFVKRLIYASIATFFLAGSIELIDRKYDHNAAWALTFILLFSIMVAKDNAVIYGAKSLNRTLKSK